MPLRDQDPLTLTMEVFTENISAKKVRKDGGQLNKWLLSMPFLLYIIHVYILLYIKD